MENQEINQIDDKKHRLLVWQNAEAELEQKLREYVPNHREKETDEKNIASLKREIAIWKRQIAHLELDIQLDTEES
jgi:hypothetical protein